MEFTCKYTKPTGEVVKAVLVGQNMDEVRHRLHEQGFLPISIKPRGWSISLRPRKRRDNIKPEDFIMFNQQFVALIKAGLPILRSLDLLKGRINNPLLRQHIEDVRDRVYSGALLSEAMRAQGVFPPVYTASVFAGERSGNLVEVHHPVHPVRKDDPTGPETFFEFIDLSGLSDCPFYSDGCGDLDVRHPAVC